MPADQTASKPTLSHQDSVRLLFPRVVQDLRPLLGNKLIAYIGGVQETRAVRQWAEGERAPSAAVQQRLRHALMAASLIGAVDSPAIVQAWFQGANPKLAYRAPATVLRDSTELGPESGEVIAAAHAFSVSA